MRLSVHSTQYIYCTKLTFAICHIKHLKISLEPTDLLTSRFRNSLKMSEDVNGNLN